MINFGIEGSAEHLRNFLQYIADKTFKKTQKSDIKRTDQPSWWNAECSRLKEEKYKALNKFRLTNNKEDLARYKYIKSKFKASCERLKKEKNYSKGKGIVMLQNNR